MVDGEPMGYVDVESAKTFFRNFMLDLVQGISFVSRALPDDFQVASFVDDHGTN